MIHSTDKEIIYYEQQKVCHIRNKEFCYDENEKNKFKLYQKVIFNETKNLFYSELDLEDISDKNYLHVQKVWDVFQIRNLGEYHDLYVQTDTLLLADVYEKFIDKCIEIYGLDPSYFLSAQGLAWKA